MAIVYEISDNGYLQPAHNNYILSFYSTTLTTPNYATVSINGIVLKYSPNLNNSFKVNLKEVIKSIVNKGNFAENKPDFSLPNDLFFAGNSTKLVTIIGSIYQGASVENFTINAKFYNGVLQSYDDDFLKIPNNGLSLLKRGSIDGYCFIYNEGYPFDLEFYSNDNLSGTLNSIKIENFTTGEILQKYINERDFRLCICDGKTDTSILNQLILVEGLNSLKMTLNSSPTSFIYFNIYNNRLANGTYIKWLNEFGSWNYWLFDCFSEMNEKIEQIGTFSYDFFPVEKTISISPSYGVKNNATLKVNTGIIEKQYYNYFKSIFKSPKIYLYTGEPFSQKTFTQWIEITIDGDYITKKPRGLNYNFDIVFSLSGNYTMTI